MKKPHYNKNIFNNRHPEEIKEIENLNGFKKTLKNF